MADFPSMKLTQRVSQNMTQVQTQKMSQTQIMSLNLLSMSSSELREEIYAKASKNPALEIVKDSFQDGASSVTVQDNGHFSDDFHYGKATKAQQEASDNFQAALEASEDQRETLSDHLEHQLNSMPLSEKEAKLCKKLIYNLDKNGFNILATAALVEKDADGKPLESESFLQHCIGIIQNLDPVGTCTDNFTQSLIVQAEIAGGASKCTLFLLNHFDFLDPPQIPKIQKKIDAYFKQNEKLLFNTAEASQKFDYDDEDIQDSLDFIRRLDPFPARNFGTNQTNYVIPDVKITQNEAKKSGRNESETAIQDDSDDEPDFIISLAKDSRPSISVAKDYQNLITQTEAQIKDGDTSEKAEKQKAELKFARASVNDAKVFIESIEYRESTILKACKVITEIQKEFFDKGPRFLVPLRQKDVAAKIGVHETTVSRMANSKFIQCKWGIFPVSYFFTNAVGEAKPAEQKDSAGAASSVEQNARAVSGVGSSSSSSAPLSKEAVKAEIAAILEEHKNEKKALSDQKISDILAEKGIKVARRTVAKYRTELNINSSYTR